MAYSVTIATCNMLAEDPYTRHSTVAPLPVSQRRQNFITNLAPLLPTLDIVCFQEWDYSDSGIVDQSIYDFFAHHNIALVGRESNLFGTMIGYKQDRFIQEETGYQTSLFGESLIYGYLSILLLDMHEQQPPLRVTTTHLPFRRKKNMTTEDYLNMIPPGKEPTSIICGDFNQAAIDFNETPFNNFLFNRDVKDPKATHRINDERPGSSDFFQSVDYIGVKGGIIGSFNQIPTNQKELISHTQNSRQSSYFSDHALLYATIQVQK